ncbi:unnamed protein product (macronuclear) [Paramecium tetraurelia]|uniref:Chromosome undetermined scaffold_1, whole genome shotgun sequence n=1 Tax=Paramecium tetraurelia TaxID=5888 RepID=Q6BFL2_PARTE|nr:MORN repeat protein [Paramecium tetraurelia strain d4-2]XP_001423093.1 uncharacterized protein GSPATT00000130001 [Paramecium tetraurelia]CAH03558.1 MORN repeat protein, putative [Paramecium tetraurelia]CAK55695.1 unnamed protein product [Paramecium tetraurelia]|eukprot:XP_001423093.1 hypothetical protein (macronuclear) [Paramecium tetraurelia strain d4-2]
MNKSQIQYCTRQHKAGQERIISICMNKHCQIRLACSYCYQDYHLNHVQDLIPIKEFEAVALNTYNEQKHFEFISLIDEKAKILQSLKNKLHEYVSQLEAEFNLDCDNLIQSFVYIQNTLLKLCHCHQHSIKEEELLTVINRYSNVEYNSIKQSIMSQLNRPIECIMKLHDIVSKECKMIQRKKFINSYIQEKELQNFYQENVLDYKMAPKKHSLIRGTMFTQEFMELEGKNKHYYGEIHKGVPYGQGILIQIDDQKIEEGIWIDGNLSWGQRSIQLKGVPSIVCGEMIDGVINGLGKMICKDGDSYTGEWINGQKHGMGIYKYANGDMYKGEFKFDLKDGQGTYKAHNGDIYIGQFEKGIKNGDGKYISKKEDTYIGKFKDDKIDGEGTYKYHDGKMYDEIQFWLVNKECIRMVIQLECI